MSVMVVKDDITMYKYIKINVRYYRFSDMI